MMKNTELVRKLIEIAMNYKTLYVRGCIGAPLTAYNKKRYTNNNAYNRNPIRQAMINAASEDTFGFDCSCLIKSVLWGWSGDTSAVYGGTKYASNGVPDINADAMINKCSDISTDFSDIMPGEAVWIQGHIGIYIGDGFAVECTPKWDNRVQITSCNCKREGFNRRNWTKHGKLPYVEYPEPIIHTVVKGDTLWGIARKYLGRGSRYMEIVEYNHLAKPAIFVGDKLKIPNE